MLPKISDILYSAKDVPDFLERLISKMQDLSGLLFYADQISIKLDEAWSLTKDPNNENAFLRKMRDKWSKDLRKELVEANIFYDSTLRRKDVFSILSKMNRTMSEGKSINSIHDLMGVEFVVLTPKEVDTPESIKQLYSTTNIILDYFSDSNKSGEKFMLCDAAPLKDVYPLEVMLDKNERPRILESLQKTNPTAYIPKHSGLLPKYLGFVKDYYRQPKIKSCYQGLQFVLKTEKGDYFEIQIKTQPAFDYKNKPGSPAYHSNYRLEQTTKKKALKNSVPQFDLSFNPHKVHHIYGFRADSSLDKSGFLAPIRWNLRKHTHF